MQVATLHSWKLTPTEAVQLQLELARHVDVRTPLAEWRLVAGADISYNRFNPTFFASVIVWRPSDGAIVDHADVVRQAAFPYVPGLLSFREGPALLEAFAKLRTEPDVIMMDGQGIAHPRRLGIASHIGLWLNLPTIGCAKSRLCGTFEEPGDAPGSLAPLKHKGEQVGYVVRTKRRVKPLFVSAGHRIDLTSAVRLVLETTRGYRLPEPTRLAHLRVNELRRRHTGSNLPDSI